MRRVSSPLTCRHYCDAAAAVAAAAAAAAVDDGRGGRMESVG